MTATNIPRTDYMKPAVHEVDVVTTTGLPDRFRRLSWGAVLGGLAMALVTMIVLNMLGLAIGAASINPQTEVNPIQPALGTGAAIWVVATNIIAMFVGGAVAGRMSGLTDELDSLIHGLVTWAMATLITIILLTSSIGNIFGAVTSAVSSGLNAVGQGLTAISPQVASALELQNASLAGIGTEVRGLLATTDGATGEGAAAGEVDAAPGLTELEITRSLTLFFTMENPTETDRQAVITLLTERTSLSEAEARENVERWETTIVQFREEAAETAREVGQAAADAISALAGLVFASMLVAAFAAGVGGIIGSPEREDVVVTTQHTVS